jgi:hypothetical protein
MSKRLHPIRLLVGVVILTIPLWMYWLGKGISYAFGEYSWILKGQDYWGYFLIGWVSIAIIGSVMLLGAGLVVLFDWIFEKKSSKE